MEEDALVHLSDAREATRDGRMADAIAASERAIRQAPGIAEAHALAGLAHFALNRLDDADRCLRQALQLEPRTEWMMSAARLAIRRGDLAGATRYWKGVVAAEPRSRVAAQARESAGAGDAPAGNGGSRTMDADRLQAWKDELARDAMSLGVHPARRRLAPPRPARGGSSLCIARTGAPSAPWPARTTRWPASWPTSATRAQAHDEWAFALRLDPSHQPSLRGLGFLAYKRRDLAGAEQCLARALHANPADDGLATALRRVRVELRGSREATEHAAGNGDAPAARRAAQRRQ